VHRHRKRPAVHHQVGPEADAVGGRGGDELLPPRFSQGSEHVLLSFALHLELGGDPLSPGFRRIQRGGPVRGDEGGAALDDGPVKEALGQGGGQEGEGLGPTPGLPEDENVVGITAEGFDILGRRRAPTRR